MGLIVSRGSSSCGLHPAFAMKLGTTLADWICLFVISSSSDLAGPDLIKFGIESKRSCEETSTETLIDAITLALEDMRGVCVEGLDPTQPTGRR
jgi:hypothetical protein